MSASIVDGGGRNRRGSIREAHRALTRGRIIEAAKELFGSIGLLAATVDQIAAAAGISRPTFYVYFRDKDDLIAEIVREYSSRSLLIIRSLSGPETSTRKVRAWLAEVVAFYQREKLSLALLYQVSHSAANAVPRIVRDMNDDIMEAYAVQLPVFRVALEPGKHQPRARAQAEVLVRQLTWACEMCAREGATAKHKAALDLTAEAFVTLLADFREISAKSGFGY